MFKDSAQHKLNGYSVTDGISNLILLAAKKFGVNEFVNPKEHNKPVQEVVHKQFNEVHCMFDLK